MRKTTIAALITFIIIMLLFAFANAQDARQGTEIFVQGMAIDYVWPYVATTNGKIFNLNNDTVALDMRDRLYYPEGPGLTAMSTRSGSIYTYSINRIDGEPVAEVLRWDSGTPTTIISFTGVLTNSHSTDFMEFSPADGSLFIGFGDSASFTEASPQHSEVLSLDSYRGKVLRINPDNGKGYADNPFCTSGDLDSMRCKVWAYGFRNPWAASWDATNDLIVVDVGDHSVEEVNSHIRGKFHGWPCFEGGKASQFIGGVPECDGTIPPLPPLPEYSYTHDAGTGIMGAVKIYGHLIVGDFTGKIFESNGKILMNNKKMLVRLLQNGNSGMIAIYFDGTTRTSELVFLDYQFFYYIPSASK